MRMILILLLASVAAAGDGRVVVKLAETPGQSGARPAVLFPRVRLDVGAKRPTGLAGVTGLSAAARFAVAQFAGRNVPLAFDQPGAALALGIVHTGGGRIHRGRARVDPQSKALVVDFRDVDTGTVRLNIRLRYKGVDLVEATAGIARHRRGRAVIGGDAREVILIDGDGDGTFNGADDRWVALKPERAAKLGVLRRPASLRIHEPQVPFYEDGTALMVEGVAADGSSLTLVRGKPSQTQAQVLARRYAEVRTKHFESFARERDAFLGRHGLAGRNLDAAPAAWRISTIGDATDGSKPVLVLFYSESNVWCFRYDYYTFRDRKVNELLQRFTLVRVDVEKDRQQNWRRYGGRGLPALMPLSSDGKAVSFRVRTRDAAGKVTELEKNERMITGWQRPQELVVNLERILQALR